MGMGNGKLYDNGNMKVKTAVALSSTPPHPEPELIFSLLLSPSLAANFLLFQTKVPYHCYHRHNHLIRGGRNIHKWKGDVMKDQIGYLEFKQ